MQRHKLRTWLAVIALIVPISLFPLLFSRGVLTLPFQALSVRLRGLWLAQHPRPTQPCFKTATNSSTSLDFVNISVYMVRAWNESSACEGPPATVVTRLIFDEPTSYASDLLLGATALRASPALASPLASSSFSTPLPSFVVLGDQEGWGGYVSVEFHALHRALKFGFSWGHVDGGSWAEVASNLARLGSQQPQVLLLFESWGVAKWGNVTDEGYQSLTAAGTQVWLYADDLHWHNEAQRAQKNSLLTSGVLDLLVGTYMPLVERFYPGAARLPRLHLPHAASAHFLLPLNPAPLPRVLLAGSTSAAYYPYRALVAAKIAAGDARFVQLRHPGYSPAELAANKATTGAHFAAALHRHLAVLTDGSILNYTVAKAFEIPATGALLLANSELTPHLANLGMYPGVHFVEYTRATLDTVVDWVLNATQRPAVDKIRGQGQALVWARHTVWHRAAALDAVARALSELTS